MDFNTGNQTFRGVLGNGFRYRVPRFQRDYAWTQDQWLDLWEDVVAATGPDGDSHYMGYLVLQRGADGNTFEVIDGQQRLATLSLLILAALFELSETDGLFADEAAEGNVQRADVIRRAYIDASDPVSLETRPKLKLNRNNDKYFRTLTRLETPPSRKIRLTERLLGDAISFFRERIRTLGTSGEGLAAFLERMSSKLFFTTITVGDELDAYRVFETLNARGVKLSTPDLLKNYIFSRLDRDGLHDEDLDELDSRWGQIGHQLGNIDFTRFVLTDWNRHQPPARKTDLFRQVRAQISDRDAAQTYLRRLESASEIFAALHAPDDEYWRQDDKDVVRNLRALTLFQIRQPYGLLMTVRQLGKPRDFARVLRWIVAVSVRYNAIGGQPHQPQIRAYSRASRDFAETKEPDVIRAAIQPLYPSDETFTDYFMRHTAATRQTPKKARFLLARIAEQIASDGIRVSDEDYSLEHILPQNLNAEWREAYGDHADEDAERLGNMALIAPGQNRDLDRAPFAEKKEVLTRSALKLNELDADQWTHEAVTQRQRRLSKTACQVWRIDFSGT